MFNRELFNNRQNEFEGTFVGDNMNIDVDMINNQTMNPTYEMPNQTSPIVEPMQQREVHRTIVHEVPHVCPIQTKIINHHVYRHTYSPSYSCCEENTCCNVQCGSCNCFK